MDNKSSNLKLTKIDQFRSRDGVRAQVYVSGLGGDPIVVIEADTVGGDPAEVTLNVKEAAALHAWLGRALGFVPETPTDLPPMPRCVYCGKLYETHPQNPNAWLHECTVRPVRTAQVKTTPPLREFAFDRYRNGKLMAEGIVVHTATEEEAWEKVKSMRPLNTDHLELRPAVSEGTGRGS